MNAAEVRAAAEALRKIDEISDARSRLAGARIGLDSCLSAGLRLPYSVANQAPEIVRAAFDAALIAELEAWERRLRDLVVDVPPRRPVSLPEIGGPSS